jgi:DNA-binding CsgD family transcriptional regulator
VEQSTFETTIETLPRLEDVWCVMVAFARDCGVARLGYHHLPPPGAPDAHLLRIENEGFAAALLAQYLSARTSGIAVLANLIQNSTRPVYLDELEKLVELTPREREHLAGYRAGGVKNGLGLQVFGPNGRNGIFALDLGSIERLSPPVLGRLRWSCQVMHLRYCALLQPMLGSVPSLSVREAEVLRWVARGKSNAAIGDILGISAHTVDAHLRRIYLKLGVFDRISAALRALGFGLIKLEG